MSGVDRMGDIEHTIDRLVTEAEETLIGLYGEPSFEDEHTETLQAVIGPMADQLRGAVDAALRDVVAEAHRRTPELSGDRFALTVGQVVIERLVGGQ